MSSNCIIVYHFLLFFSRADRCVYESAFCFILVTRCDASDVSVVGSRVAPGLRHKRRPSNDLSPVALIAPEPFIAASKAGIHKHCPDELC